MSKEIYNLVRRPDLVLETRRAGESGSLEGFEGGRKVSENRFLLRQIILTAFLILPRLVARSRRLPLLWLGRGLVAEPGEPPVFWLPARVAGTCPAVFFDFQYDPSSSRFLAGTNAGGAGDENVYTVIGDAPPEIYTGRVLRVFAIIDRDGAHVLVEDPFSDEVAIYGEGVKARGGSSKPWDGPPRGDWYVRFGHAGPDSEPVSVLPAGYALSDLQITFLGDSGEDYHLLDYGGALDHLVSPASLKPPTTASRVLRIVAGNLRATAGDLETLGSCLGPIRGAGDVVIGRRPFKRASS